MKTLFVSILFLFAALTVHSQGVWSLMSTVGYEGNNVLLHAVDGSGDTCVVAGAVGLPSGFYLPLLARSTDGGETWSEIDPGLKNNSEMEVGARLNSVTFLDPSTVIAVGAAGTILRSTDAGASWKPSESPTLYPLMYISFSDSLVGIVGSDYPMLGTMLRTVDAGATWDTVALPSGSRSYDVACLSRWTFVVVGDDDTLMRTTDAGVTWNFVKTGAKNRMRLLFQDSLVGWMYGSGNRDLLLKTTDGGSTWKETLNEPGAGILLLSFCDHLNGIAVRNIGTIAFDRLFIRTTDGGETWESMDAPYDMRLGEPVNRWLSYVNPNRAYGVNSRTVSQYLDDGTLILRQPRIVYPEAIEIDINTPLEVAWRAVQGATGYDMQIARQYAGGSNGGLYDQSVYSTSLLLDKQGVSDTSATLDSQLQAYTRYYCRVRAIDNTGTYAPSDWNESFFFVPKTSGIETEGRNGNGTATVYPQPASGSVSIRFTNVANGVVDLLNLAGEVVATNPIVAAGDGSGRVSFDVGELPPGIYWSVPRGAVRRIACPVVVR